MEVLAQEWSSPGGGGFTTSISLNRKQLDAKIAEFALREDSDAEDAPEYPLEPDGDAWEVNIPDESAFPEMVKRSTVFLEPDEMHILY